MNTGQLPQYYVEEAHEPIIDKAIFQAVQEERVRRARRFITKPIEKIQYPFTSIMVCECCGKKYKRKVTATGPVWICSTYDAKGKAQCGSKQIPETTLMETAASVLGTDAITDVLVHRLVDGVRVCNGNRLVFTMKDGREIEKKWQDRSRSQSWTPEMKEAARQKALERRKKNG